MAQIIIYHISNCGKKFWFSLFQTTCQRVRILSQLVKMYQEERNITVIDYIGCFCTSFLLGVLSHVSDLQNSLKSYTILLNGPHAATLMVILITIYQSSFLFIFSAPAHMLSREGDNSLVFFLFNNIQLSRKKSSPAIVPRHQVGNQLLVI